MRRLAQPDGGRRSRMEYNRLFRISTYHQAIGVRAAAASDRLPATAPSMMACI
jgi:hypothetical protein